MKTQAIEASPAMRTAFINTPLQRGGRAIERPGNRFNGFGQARETVKTVSSLLPADATPLKRGVNETALSGLQRRGTDIRSPEGVTQIFNLLYRRFVIGTESPRFRRAAGCKPAIQQITNLRYGSRRAAPSVLGRLAAFTLLELLVVIGIIGLLAALSVPVLGNFKPNHAANASRVLMDDLARARQLAISEHTTVLMVFVKTNFWNQMANPPVAKWRAIDYSRATNLVSKQLIGYTFVSLRSLGDQPGMRTPQYLSGWKTLPEGAFIAFQKFALPSGSTFIIRTNDANGNLVANPVVLLDSFNYTTQVPFPLLDTLPFSPKQPYVMLPYIAFNYLGQRCDDNGTPIQQNAVFPLAKGAISFARDEATHLPKFSSPTVLEQPPGNATNGLSYSLVYVDWLTGRARAIQQEVR